MKAAFIETQGPPSNLQFGDLPDPQPADDEVIVRVGASSVNPIDTYIRSGAVAAELPVRWIPGCDVAGTVESVGADVTRFQPGDRVWASNQSLFGRQGTLAELVSVQEQWLYPTPNGVSDEDAAAASLVGITAHLGLYLHAGLQSDDVVFVNGGTGGVGSSVVQIAHAAGARVITTVGSDEKVAAAVELGATAAINYRREDVQQRLIALTEEHGKVSLWFETLRNASPETTFPHLRKRGRYVLMAGRDARPEFPVGAFYVNDLRAFGFAMFNASPEEQRESADYLNELLAAGKLKPLIGARFTLSDAAAAHALQEDNTLQSAGTLSGKIIVTP